MTSDERTYTVEQIKAAFWRQFYEAGELWFGDHRTSDKDALIETFWSEFTQELDKETAGK